MTGSARTIPPPPVNPETKPFWDAAAQGRLLIKRCTACDEPHWYPRAICPFCGSERTEWMEASGHGTIYSYSVFRRARRGTHDDDQHRRLRSGRDPDRPGSPRGVQAHGRRAAGADVRAGLARGALLNIRARGEWPCGCCAAEQTSDLRGQRVHEFACCDARLFEVRLVSLLPR